MRGDGSDAACTVLLQQVCCQCNAASGVHHIIHQNYVGALHVSDYLHAGHFVCLLPCFVAEHERTVQILAICVRALAAAHVWCGDNKILEVQALNVR